MGSLEESYMILITELAFQPHANARVNFRNVCTNAVSLLCKLVKKKVCVAPFSSELHRYRSLIYRCKNSKNTGLTVTMKFKLAVL